MPQDETLSQSTSSDAAGTPAALGYRMPAEWEPHAATWLSWPRPDGISFPGAYEEILPILAKMVAALADSEIVRINVGTGLTEEVARRALAGGPLDHVEFVDIPTNEPWCRDHGPIFVVKEAEPRRAIVDWGYNAWGGKYPPFDLDNAVPETVATRLGLPLFRGGMVLEGGSIDVNGSGALLTTESCLLNPNRNPDLSREQIEARLREFLGVCEILWLGDGIAGDDTDGHVDDLTRFVAGNRVVTVVEENVADTNHRPLAENRERLRALRVGGSSLEVLELPMPSPIVREGLRLPASYANFYIANSVVLLPVFGDAKDSTAVGVLEDCFPERRIVPIDARSLVWGLGAFHCLTQQEPR